MKNDKIESEKQLKLYAEKINNIYLKRLKLEIPRAIILGGCTVYEILAENFILEIDNAKTEIEKELAINKLIEKIKIENANVKKQKFDANFQINLNTKVEE